MVLISLALFASKCVSTRIVMSVSSICVVALFVFFDLIPRVLRYSIVNPAIAETKFNKLYKNDN